MGNVLETERLLWYAKNSILANRQQKPSKANCADSYYVTSFFFGMLFLGGFANLHKISDIHTILYATRFRFFYPDWFGLFVFIKINCNFA